MDCKYLSDGRKVVVVGALNNQETIVQEIFVAKNGDEIPGGERFVVKSLHDQPVKSYKEKAAEKAEQQEAECRAKIERLNIEERALRMQIAARKDIFKSSTRLASILNEQELDRLAMFMSGDIEYVVINSYAIRNPVKFIDIIQDIDRLGYSVRYEGLKLISMLGSSEGDISYRINQYRDGSGGWDEIVPFSSHEQAVKYLAKRACEKIMQDRLSPDEYKTCLALGIVFDRTHADKYLEKQSEAAKKRLEDLEKQSRKIRVEMEALRGGL